MKKHAQIKYFTLKDEMLKKEKLEWFADNRIADIPFESIQPDKNGNWLNITDNDFEELLPLIDKKSKQSVFEFSSLGVSTNRDEWVYDFDKENLRNKMKFFIEKYNEFLAKNDTSWNESIKWSEFLKNVFIRKEPINFNVKLILQANYRPFIKQFGSAIKVMLY